MLKFRMKDTGRVVTEDEYRREHNTVFPAVFTPTDADVIFETPKPSPDSTQYVSEGQPVQDILGNWVQSWILNDYDPQTYNALLASEKTARLSMINTWREAANKTTFTHQGKTIQCDSLSRSDLDATANHIALFGTFPPGFPGGWKAADNSIIYLPTIAAFKDMYASMTQQGTSNFTKSQQLKSQVAAATTIEQVREIVW